VKFSSFRNIPGDLERGVVLYISDLQYEVTCEVLQLWSRTTQDQREDTCLTPPPIIVGSETTVHNGGVTTSLSAFVYGLGSRMQHVVGMQHTHATLLDFEGDDFFMDCTQQSNAPQTPGRLDKAKIDLSISVDIPHVVLHLMYNCNSNFDDELECSLKKNVKSTFPSSSGIFCTVALSTASLTAKGSAFEDFSGASLSDVAFNLAGCSIESHRAHTHTGGVGEATSLTIFRIKPFELSAEIAHANGSGETMPNCIHASYKGNRTNVDAIDLTVGTIQFIMDPLCADHISSFFHESLVFIPPPEHKLPTSASDGEARDNAWIAIAVMLEAFTWNVSLGGIVGAFPTCYGNKYAEPSTKQSEEEAPVSETPVSLDLLPEGCRPAICVSVQKIMLQSSEAENEVCAYAMTSTCIFVDHEAFLESVQRQATERVRDGGFLLNWPEFAATLKYDCKGKGPRNSFSWEDSMEILQSTTAPSLSEDDEQWRVFDSCTQNLVERFITFSVALGTIDVNVGDSDLRALLWLLGLWSQPQTPAEFTADPLSETSGTHLYRLWTSGPGGGFVVSGALLGLQFEASLERIKIHSESLSCSFTASNLLFQSVVHQHCTDTQICLDGMSLDTTSHQESERIFSIGPCTEGKKCSSRTASSSMKDGGIRDKIVVRYGSMPRAALTQKYFISDAKGFGCGRTDQLWLHGGVLDLSLDTAFLEKLLSTIELCTCVFDTASYARTAVNRSLERSTGYAHGCHKRGETVAADERCWMHGYCPLSFRASTLLESINLQFSFKRSGILSLHTDSMFSSFCLLDPEPSSQAFDDDVHTSKVIDAIGYARSFRIEDHTHGHCSETSKIMQGWKKSNPHAHSEAGNFLWCYQYHIPNEDSTERVLSSVPSTSIQLQWVGTQIVYLNGVIMEYVSFFTEHFLPIFSASNDGSDNSQAILNTALRCGFPEHIVECGRELQDRRKKMRENIGVLQQSSKAVTAAELPAPDLLKLEIVISNSRITVPEESRSCVGFVIDFDRVGFWFHDGSLQTYIPIASTVSGSPFFYPGHKDDDGEVFFEATPDSIFDLGFSLSPFLSPLPPPLPPPPPPLAAQFSLITY
jgi:hypothetical protein